MFAPAFDVVPLLRHVAKALNTYADAHCIQLSFKTASNRAVISCDAQTLSVHFANLLCQLINFLPAHKTIEVSCCAKEGAVTVDTSTDYMDLSRVHEITDKNALGVRCFYAGHKTCFRFTIGLPASPEGEEINTNQEASKHIRLPNFYAEVGKRLRSHFNKAENLVSLLYNHHPGEARFLQQVNTVIEANMDNESFDTLVLCGVLNISRTQLFRRLKPLIRQAPACYIKSLRLQKAKQLLETTDYTVGEVSFKTGFVSQSHFTKVFTKHYGVPPSLFKRKRGGTK